MTTDRLYTKAQDEGLVHYATTDPTIPRFQVVGVLSGTNLIGDGFGLTNIDPHKISFLSSAFIQEESHLPSAINGVITLEPNTKYFICGQVSLTDNTRILAGLSSGIVGFNAPTDKIVGNVDSPLITIVDDGTNYVSHVYFCTIQNNNTGSLSTAITVSASNTSTFVAQESRLISSGKAGIDIYTCANTKLANTNIAGKTGIIINPGDSSILFDNIASQATEISRSCVHVMSGSSLTIFTFTNSAVIGLSPSNIGIRIENTGSIDNAKVDTVLAVGPVLFNSGWDQTVVGYSIRDCPSLPDSATGGGSVLTLSSSVSNTQNVWQDISNGANIYTLSSGSERFNLSSSLNGEIVYIGNLRRKMFIQGAVSFAMNSGGTNTVRYGIYKNGSLISSSVADTNAQSARFSSVSTIPILVDANTNDRFKIRMMNIDSSTDIIFQTVGLTAIALGK